MDSLSMKCMIPKDTRAQGVKGSSEILMNYNKLKILPMHKNPIKRKIE